MKKQKRAAAIHDISCFGRCSLTVVLPILSSAGIYTVPLPTAVLSAHTAIKGFTYKDLTGEMEPITDHFSSMNLEFDALFSGFLGTYEQIDLVSKLFDRFKTKDNIIMVDPAMADHGRMYSVYDMRMAGGMRKLLEKGNIIVPNITEAAFILGRDYKEGPYEPEYIEGLLQGLLELGSEMAVLTGVFFDNDKLGVVSARQGTHQYSYYFSDKIEGHFHGTGDIFASTLLAGLLNDLTLAESVQTAVDYTCLCISLTVNEGRKLSDGVCFEKAIPYLIKKLGVMIY